MTEEFSNNLNMNDLDYVNGGFNVDDLSPEEQAEFRRLVEELNRCASKAYEDPIAYEAALQAVIKFLDEHGIDYYELKNRLGLVVIK